MMRQSTIRWVTALVFALLLALGSLLDAPQAPVAHGEEPTPTPTVSTNSDPGGSGGGH